MSARGPERSTMLSIDAARAALHSGTGTGIRVAILDSGVEADHPDLGGIDLEDDVAIESDGMTLHVSDGRGVDVYGHGTAIAGIIRSVAPAARIGSFRVLNGNLGSRTEIIREGVRQAIDRGYDILNCSFGCVGSAKYVMQYKEWVDEAYLEGIHIVAACNNYDVTTPEWPGHFTTVITVNMARTDGLQFYYSPTQLVEFAARGHDLSVAWSDGSRRDGICGSSYAAPHVAGLLARILSVHPGLPPLEAKAVLHRLAEPFDPQVAGTNVRAEIRDAGTHAP